MGSFLLTLFVFVLYTSVAGTHTGAVCFCAHMCVLFSSPADCVGDGWQLCTLPAKSHTHTHSHTYLACSFSSQLLSMKMTRLSNAVTLCHTQSPWRRGKNMYVKYTFIIFKYYYSIPFISPNQYHIHETAFKLLLMTKSVCYAM